MKVVILGDIGNSAYHAGDELMAVAAVEELRRRVGVDVVAVSADPEATTARYGWSAVPRLGFSGLTGAGREARLEAVESAVSAGAPALAWDDPAWGVINAVTGADAVLVTGGGNLSSRWPEHVYERAALGRLAAALGRPLVVSGQTLGPHLTARHGELVAQLLVGARRVGVRERASWDVAVSLEVPTDRLAHTLDDAAFVAESSAGWVAPDGPYVAATFAPDSGLVPRKRYVAALADLLRRAREMTGWPVLLVPHLAGPDGARTGDVALHDEIAAAMGDPGVISVATADHAVTAARHASLVISSRYHPVVFALSAGVPALGLGTDLYTTTKISGAMANMGVASFAVGPASLVAGDVDQAVADLVERREELAGGLAALAASRRAESSAGWDEVVAALGGTPDLGRPTSLAPAPEVAPGDWAMSARALRDWTDELSDRLDGTALAAEGAVDELLAEQEAAAAARLAASAARAELDDAAEEVATLRAALDAAYAISAPKLAPLVRQSLNDPVVDALQAELEALRATRTFRYTAGLRRVWSRVRHVLGRG